jgi:hypothetical protein
MTNPQAMMQYSDDGGRTWSAEQWRDLVGPDKNYLNRLRFFCQGSCMQRIYRLTHTENQSFTIISAHAKISFGI